MADAASESVRCLQVPLQGGMALLLPNAAVAEVLPYRAPQGGAADDPRLLGRLDWRGVTLAVLSFEAFCGQPCTPPPRGAQLIVLHRLDLQAPTRYYALAASGIPHLTVARPGTLQAAASANSARPVLQTVMLGDTPLMIPDFERLEAALAALGG
jgi:chemosensory pili system protein ChpC